MRDEDLGNVQQRHLDRFWSCVEISDGCWDWVAPKSSTGYGYLKVHYKYITAHRFSYAIHNNQAPGDMFVCHTCDNPACVNPSHLYLGTHADNVADRVERGRSAIGEADGNSKMRESDVVSMRAEFGGGNATYNELAEKYGIYQATARSIVLGETWRHVGGACSPPPKRLGSRHGLSKIVESDAVEIRRLHSCGMSAAAIARGYPISDAAVRKIIKRETWAHAEAAVCAR